MKCSLGIYKFLEEISSLSHSIVFLCFFALTTEGGFLISLCYSLELFIQMGVCFLYSFVFASLLGSRRYPGEGNGNPLQYFCLVNSTDSGAWHSPWGRKESDMTDHTDHIFFVSLWIFFCIHSSSKARPNHNCKCVKRRCEVVVKIRSCIQDM